MIAVVALLLSITPASANPCAICHLTEEGQHMRSTHFEREVACQACHGKSQRHMVAEDNSARPSRPLDGPKAVRKQCLWCHSGLPKSCPKKESCVTCHDPHSSRFQPGTEVIRTEDFEAGDAENWTFREEDQWTVEEEEGNHYLSLKTNGQAGAEPRRPATLALMKGPRFSSFTFTCRARNTDPLTVRGRSIVVPFCFTDVKRFYYIHFCNFSNDVHNNALIVNEADRAPLKRPNDETPPVFTDEDWHTLRVVRDAETGVIEAYYDDALLHRATDTTHASGLIGVGTFNSKGDYDDIRIEGAIAETGKGKGPGR